MIGASSKGGGTEMPEREEFLYWAHTTSGGPAIEESSVPSSNLSAMMRNNTMIFESRTRWADQLYLRSLPTWIGGHPVAYREPVQQYEPIGAAELDALIERHFERFDEVFRRLT